MVHKTLKKIDSNTPDNVTIVGNAEKSPSLKLDLSSIKNNDDSELGGDNRTIDLKYYKDM